MPHDISGINVFGRYTYKRKNCVMTSTERDFFKFLASAVGDRYYIFPQVHLSAILHHNAHNQGWRGAFAHINGKSVDFVLCDPIHLCPIAAIELDDRTHLKPDRVLRDIEVARILSEARIPLLRFCNPSKLIKEDVARRIVQTITYGS